MEQDRAAEALDAAMRALRFRDLSTHDLRARLEEKEFAPAACDTALASLERTGLVDDRRFAENRARALAARGSGDAFIRYELERARVPVDAIEGALEALDPEVERARTIAARRGSGPKAARYLHSKGFSDETVV